MFKSLECLKRRTSFLTRENTSAGELCELFDSMKCQLKEILSFLHPRSIESIYKAIDLLDAKLPKSEIAQYYAIINRNQTEIVRLLAKVEEKALAKEVRDRMDDLRVLDMERVYRVYSDDERALDLVLIEDLKELVDRKSKGRRPKNFCKHSKKAKKVSVS